PAEPDGDPVTARANGPSDPAKPSKRKSDRPREGSMRRTTNNRFRRAGRPGFTLVELMVMAAVCVLIMAILASVFQTGIDAMRQVRSSGDMMDQLRSAGEVLKKDLQTDHFLPDQQPGNPSERTRLSDYRFDLGAPPPRGGFFRIISPASINEGIDADGLVSYRATNHQVHFTSVLPDGKDENKYSATLTPPSPPAPAGTKNVYTSRAAEIAYFLVPDPGRFTNGPGSQQLYLLIRRQRLVAYTSADLSALRPAPTDQPPPAGDVMSPNAPPVNPRGDLTIPSNRLTLPTLLNTTAPTNRVGDDVLLSNVLSFEVKVLWIPMTGGVTPRPFGSPGAVPPNTLDNPSVYPVSTDAPYDTLAGLPATPVAYTNRFDTGSGAPAANGGLGAPPQIRVKALQIRLRIFHAKLKNARQSTFVVEM